MAAKTTVTKVQTGKQVLMTVKSLNNFKTGVNEQSGKAWSKIELILETTKGKLTRGTSFQDVQAIPFLLGSKRMFEAEEKTSLAGKHYIQWTEVNEDVSDNLSDYE
jgi:hypothetical protein